jgi:hypothetical protein
VKLLSLDRQYVLDLARDHVWRFDQSPARQLERQQSMERTLHLAMGDRQPQRTPERTMDRAAVERTLERVRSRQPSGIQHGLRELAAALSQEDEPTGGVALRPRLYQEREREQDYGLSF